MIRPQLVFTLFACTLGVTLQHVSAQSVSSTTFGFTYTIQIGAENNPIGLLIKTVTKDGPADKAGVTPGNIITKIGATEVISVEDLEIAEIVFATKGSLRLSIADPGDPNDADKDDDSKTINKLTPTNNNKTNNNKKNNKNKKSTSGSSTEAVFLKRIGLELEQVTIDGEKAIRIKKVTPASDAANAMLMDGDIVREVNGKTVLTLPAVVKQIQAGNPPTRIRFEIGRNDNFLNKQINLTGQVSVSSPSSRVALEGKYFPGIGFVVTNVTGGKNAHYAGLRPGDRIDKVIVNGKSERIRNASNLDFFLGKSTKNDIIVQVVRGTGEATLRLSKLPPPLNHSTVPAAHALQIEFTCPHGTAPADFESPYTITKCVINGLAKDCGLQVGDRIYSIDRSGLSKRIHEVPDSLWPSVIADTFQLTYSRVAGASARSKRKLQYSPYLGLAVELDDDGNATIVSSKALAYSRGFRKGMVLRNTKKTEKLSLFKLVADAKEKGVVQLAVTKNGAPQGVKSLAIGNGTIKITNRDKDFVEIRRILVDASGKFLRDSEGFLKYQVLVPRLNFGQYTTQSVPQGTRISIVSDDPKVEIANVYVNGLTPKPYVFKPR